MKQPWTSEQLWTAADLMLAGYSVPRIAKAIGRTEYSVGRYLARRGIRPNRTRVAIKREEFKRTGAYR